MTTARESHPAGKVSPAELRKFRTLTQERGLSGQDVAAIVAQATGGRTTDPADLGHNYDLAVSEVDACTNGSKAGAERLRRIRVAAGWTYSKAGEREGGD